ncbi:MAG: ATP12 family chaperone protein, partial [Rickettsiales bacterium]|nr:ATP12 family chaperone protein [Rickettsiales bacterium]
MTTKPAFTTAPESGAHAIQANGKTLTTPDKRPFVLPTQALAEAIAAEFATHGKFAAGKMPLATLAQTAIDRIDAQKELIVESLLTYVDTDALVYRSSSSASLLTRQKEQWDPVLAWLKTRLDASWETTTGV